MTMKYFITILTLICFIIITNNSAVNSKTSFINNYNSLNEVVNKKKFTITNNKTLLFDVVDSKIENDNKVILKVQASIDSNKIFLFYILIFGLEDIENIDEIKLNSIKFFCNVGNCDVKLNDLEIVLRYGYFNLFIKKKKWVKYLSNCALAVLVTVKKYEEYCDNVNIQYNFCKNSLNDHLDFDIKKLYKTYSNDYNPVYIFKFIPKVDRYAFQFDKQHILKSKPFSDSYSFYSFLALIYTESDISNIKIKANIEGLHKACDGNFSNLNFELNEGGKSFLINTKWDREDNKSFLAINVIKEHNKSKKMKLIFNQPISTIKDILIKDTYNSIFKWFSTDWDSFDEKKYYLEINDDNKLTIVEDKDLILNCMISKNDDQIFYKNFLVKFQAGKEIDLAGKEFNKEMEIKVIDIYDKPIKSLRLYTCSESNCLPDRQIKLSLTDKNGIVKYMFNNDAYIYYRGDIYYANSIQQIKVLSSDIKKLIKLKPPNREVYFKLIKDNAEIENGRIEIVYNNNIFRSIREFTIKGKFYKCEIESYIHEPFNYSALINNKPIFSPKKYKFECDQDGDCKGLSKDNPIIIEQSEPNVKKLNIPKMSITVMNQNNNPVQDIQLKLFQKNEDTELHDFGKTNKEGIIESKKIKQSGIIKSSPINIYCESNYDYPPPKIDDSIIIYLENYEKTLTICLKNGENNTPVESADIKINKANREYTAESIFDNANKGCYNVTFECCAPCKDYTVTIEAEGFIPKEKLETFSVKHFETPIDYTLTKSRKENYKINVSPVLTYNNKQENAYEFDNDLKVKVVCESNSIEIPYKRLDVMYSKNVKCTNKSLKLEIESSKFEKYTETLTLGESYISIKPELYLEKPILYALINPSGDFKKGIIRKNISIFIDLKEIVFYNIIKELSSLDRWSGIFAFNQLTNRQSIFEKTYTKDTSQDFLNNLLYKVKTQDGIESKKIKELINNSIDFFKDYSFDKSIKGLVFLFLPIPSNPYYKNKNYLNELEELLKTNKVIVCIAMFGFERNPKKYYAVDNAYLQIFEYNINDEIKNFNKTAKNISDLIKQIEISKYR